MNTSNKYDFLESLIFELGLRISSITVYQPQNLILVLLNSRSILQVPISRYKFFNDVSPEQLSNHELIADGIGVSWPELDEDLSLKGFLREEIKWFLGLNSEEPDGSGGSKKYAMAA